MDIHQNARLTLWGRGLLAQTVLQQGVTWKGRWPRVGDFPTLGLFVSEFHPVSPRLARTAHFDSSATPTSAPLR